MTPTLAFARCPQGRRRGPFVAQWGLASFEAARQEAS
jgi:hypothetical protein